MIDILNFIGPATINYISGNQIVNEGSDLRLNCTAEGNPVPNITWTRPSDNSIVRMPLTNINVKDEGIYRCTADNGIGKPVTKDVLVNVHCKCSLIKNDLI